MSFHMCTMLWHYPQKYTVVWVTGSPLFGSDVSYEQAHCHCLSPLRTVHLSFSGESTTPKVDFQSPSMPHLSLSVWSSRVRLCCMTGIQSRYMLMFLVWSILLLYVPSVMSGQAWDVTTFIHCAPAGDSQGSDLQGAN